MLEWGDSGVLTEESNFCKLPLTVGKSQGWGMSSLDGALRTSGPSASLVSTAKPRAGSLPGGQTSPLLSKRPGLSQLR